MCFLIKNPKIENALTIPNRPRRINAFVMSMKQQEPRTAITYKPETNIKHDSFNVLVDLYNLQLSKDLLASGTELLDYVVEELWTVDGTEAKSMAAHAHGKCKILPDFCAKIYEKNYCDFKQQKKAKLQLKRELLLKCSNDLFDKLSVFNHLEKINKQCFENFKMIAGTLHRVVHQ